MSHFCVFSGGHRKIPHNSSQPWNGARPVMILENKQIRREIMWAWQAGPSKKWIFHKKSSASSDEAPKKEKNGGSTSLMWVSWGHVCQQFLLAPVGEVRKSTNNPQNIHVNFGKDRRVAKSQKAAYCWRKKCCTVWHLSNPSTQQDIYFHNHQSHIWLITTEISQVPHTNDLFKGTSSTRKGTGFLAPAVRNELQAYWAYFSPS